MVFLLILLTTDEGKDAWKLISGDTKDGVWELTLTVPQGKASGEYYFYSGQFYDVNGVGAYCYSNTTNEGGSPGCVDHQYDICPVGNDNNKCLHYKYITLLRHNV